MSNLLEIGLGVLVQAGIAFSDSPEPSTFILPRSGDVAEQGALSAPVVGAGLSAELRLLQKVGMELGAYYSRDRLRGDLRRGSETIGVRLGQDALHVPLQLKGILPLSPLAPFVSAGVEYVLPTLPLAASEPPGAIGVAATADPYWNLLAGAGVELRAPWRDQDLRIPLGLRFAYQPGLGGAFDDRLRVLPSDAIIYTSTPRYSVQLTAGVSLFL